MAISTYKLVLSDSTQKTHTVDFQMLNGQSRSDVSLPRIDRLVADCYDLSELTELLDRSGGLELEDVTKAHILSMGTGDEREASFNNPDLLSLTEGYDEDTGEVDPKNEVFEQYLQRFCELLPKCPDFQKRVLREHFFRPPVIDAIKQYVHLPNVLYQNDLRKLVIRYTEARKMLLEVQKMDLELEKKQPSNDDMQR